jgi:hypothetical protein
VVLQSVRGEGGSFGHRAHHGNVTCTVIKNGCGCFYVDSRYHVRCMRGWRPSGHAICSCRRWHISMTFGLVSRIDTNVTQSKDNTPSFLLYMTLVSSKFN